MRLTWSLSLFAGYALLGSVQSSAQVKFEKDVLPIFTQYCFGCHGKTSPQLGLDLRTGASTLRGSQNGPVIAKGSPEKSLLFQKISAKAMPPPAYNQKLPDAQIEIIRTWIADGALFDQAAEPVSKDAAQQRHVFDSELLPIFQAKCVQCHGAGKPMGGLDLRSFSSLMESNKNDPVVVEGYSEKSILVRKLASRAMPPPGAGTPLTDEQVGSIRRWIDKGHFADSVQLEPQKERDFTKAEAPQITEKDRAFWSFRKPVASTPPKVKTAGRVRTPVDAFVLSRLESKGLTFSADASSLTLVRRAYFDLTGLPPTPEELQAFLDDTKFGAYERLIDHLLASPQYGERWGRYWLDAIGYVETTEKDFDPIHVELAKGMWRYRDYVIKATNQDKPWNRFLTEQIAGDELVDWRSETKYTPETVDLLTATGYMRNVLDITDPDITNLPVERYEALFKLMEKVAGSTMGLTVGCARCHTHKFDPIPQRDYYRMLALFTSSYNPTDWLQPKNRQLYTVSKPEQEEIDKHNKEIDHSLEGLNKQLATLKRPYEERLFEEKLKKDVPEAIREDVRIAIATAADKRDEIQKFLFTKFGKTLKVESAAWHKILNDADKASVERLESQIKTLTGYRSKLEPIQALWDVGQPPAIRLLQRGSVETPGPKVDPGFLTVLCAPGKADAIKPSETQGKTSGYRLAFADWLVSKDNPLTARVIVNRIWQHHFGKGIVETPDNFGKMGAPPVNPELLDWLAVDFMEHGWSAKRLHKQIMMSTAYRQESHSSNLELTAKAKTADPDNQLLWRMNLRRLEAESLRDSVLAAGGKLDRTMFGPPVMLQYHPDGLQTVPENDPGANRRSVYLLARRTYPLTFLRLFDFPIIDASCTRRVPSATPLQSLALMNDEFIVENAALLADRIEKLSGEKAPPEKKIATAYLLTLSRKPVAAEIAICEEHLKKQEELFTRANVPRAEAALKALASLSQTLLSSNEFLYID
jgi:mono/diheme cytochrome c family protein